MLVLSFFIIGILFGHLKIIVKKFDYETNHDLDYEIKAGVYLFGKIKIFGITFEEDKLRFLGFKVYYAKLKEMKFYKNVIEDDEIKFDKKFVKDKIKCLDMQFEKLKLNLKFTTDSTLMTSFLTFAISTVISFIMQRTVKKYNPKNHYFVITPTYESRNNFKLTLELVASFKLKNILKVIKDLNNLSKTEHIKNKISFNKEIKI